MTDKPDPPAETSPDLLAEALASLRNLIHSVGKRSDRKDILSEPTQPEDPTRAGHVVTAKPSVGSTDAAAPRGTPSHEWHDTTTEEDDIPTLHRVVYRPSEPQTNPTSLAADQALVPDQAVQPAGADTALGEYPEDTKGPATDPQLETQHGGAAHRAAEVDPSTSHTQGTDQSAETVGTSANHTQAETAVPDSVRGDIARPTPEEVAAVAPSMTPNNESPETAAEEGAVTGPVGAAETHLESPQTAANPVGGAEMRLVPPEPDAASTEGITDDPDPKLETTLTEADEDIVLTRYTAEPASMEPHAAAEPTATPENATSARPLSGMTTQAMAACAVDLIDAKLHDRVNHNLHPDLAEELRQMLQEMLDDWTANQ